MPEILHLLKTRAPRERVYRALSTGEGIRNWWTRDADLAETVGGAGEFRFGAYGGGQVTRVRIAELLSPERVSWETVSSFRPEWNGTRITFALRAEGDGTWVHFAHSGFREADDVFALCTTGWGYYLVSLQQYVETGRGAPSPDVDFARMVRGDCRGAAVP